jgi:hypothetical protein
MDGAGASASQGSIVVGTDPAVIAAAVPAPIIITVVSIVTGAHKNPAAMMAAVVPKCKASRVATRSHVTAAESGATPAKAHAVAAAEPGTTPTKAHAVTAGEPVTTTPKAAPSTASTAATSTASTDQDEWTASCIQWLLL